jgi:hypothetical protein
VFYRRRRSTRVRWTQSSISTILHRLRHLFNHLILSTLETLSNEMLCISVCLIRPTARCFAFLACLWWCRPLEAGNISPGQVIDSWSCFDGSSKGQEAQCMSVASMSTVFHVGCAANAISSNSKFIKDIVTYFSLEIA